MASQLTPRVHSVRLAPLLLGLVLFLANEAPVFMGCWSAPPGYRPVFLPSHMDSFQYETWIQAYRRTDAWLLPDYHAAWSTEPALINPLCWFVARASLICRLDPLWILHALYLALCIAGGYGLFFTCRAFTESRVQARLALLMAFCCVPVASLATLVGPAFAPSNRWLDLASLMHTVVWKYNSDAFLNGSSPNPFVVLGTVTTIWCMGLLAEFHKTGSRRYLRGAGAIVGVAAFLHPFEVFVVVGAGGLALLLREGGWLTKIHHALWLAVPGLLGLSPYLYLAARHTWLREAAVQNRWDAFSPIMLVFMLGVPAIFGLLSLIVPLGRKSATDSLLLLWFLGTLVGVYVPWIPWSHHLLDGLYCGMGLLLVRQACRWRVTERLWNAQPQFSRACVASLLVASLAVHAIVLADATRRAPVPGTPGATVLPNSDYAVLAWLRRHTTPDDLVLAPQATAGLFATAPMHSFASHWLFSLDWDRQTALSDAFYKGSMQPEAAEALVRNFGIRYALIPDGSPAGQYFVGREPAARIESIAVYRFDPSMRNAR